MKTAEIRALFYVDQRPPWTGPVVRHDPDQVRQPSVHLTRRCTQPWCGHWMSTAALLAGECNICHRPQHRHNV